MDYGEYLAEQYDAQFCWHDEEDDCGCEILEEETENE